MFELVALALFQIATLFGSPTEQSSASSSTSTTTAPAPTAPDCTKQGGSGGWGHD